MAVVTFSREAHSGTQDLARLLAQRLGYRFVSRDELTAAVTAHSGVERIPQTSESEGRALSRWEQLGEQLTGERATYVASLKAVINELALADNVVIVGHGAGQFLSNMHGIVRVFVVAPMDDRVARLMAAGVNDADTARRLAAEQDRESAAYLRYLFGIDWLDPHAWDLTINAGRTHLNATLDMLVHYTEGLVRDQGEQDRLAEQQLASRVEQGLLADTCLGVDKLSVSSQAGVVVLEGEALTIEDRARAESLASELAGAARVDNRIVVRPPTFS